MQLAKMATIMARSRARDTIFFIFQIPLSVFVFVPGIFQLSPAAGKQYITIPRESKGQKEKKISAAREKTADI